MKSLHLHVAILIACALNVAQAQSMHDPMRPPAFSATADAATPSGPVLQSIFIAKDRRHAIISGERVALGESYGEAKVVQISENEVTLRDAAGDVVLKLVPEIKKPIVAPKTIGRDAQGERGQQ